MDVRKLAMYLVHVEAQTRDDITAAVAAHQDLGREYDGAIAQGLVEQIGAEIDKRVDARLGQSGKRRSPVRPAAQPVVEPAGRPGWAPLVMGLGSMGLGIGAAAAVLNAGGGASGGQGGKVWLVALIWIVIAVINVAYARRR